MSYKQLTMTQRYQIEALMKEALSMRAIGRNLGVSHTTISREIRRNSLEDGGYNASSASISTRLRYQYKSKNKRLTKKHISYIREHLKEGWSPEQISGRMEIDGYSSISHETIYQYIYRKSNHELHQYLRHKNKKYTKRSASHRRRGHIKDRVSIEERAHIVEEKSRVGDWEIDTVIGKNHHQGIVTIVDRHSKFTLMKKVPSKHAYEVTKATLELMRPIKQHTLTITSDNGKEFAYHKKIATALETDFYFAHPYRSCERGLNEHTNGLIREYFPKKTEFQYITDTQIVDVQNRLNSRPRKILGYKTPAEVFFATISESYSVA
jgi:transposase, IS30 family